MLSVFINGNLLLLSRSCNLREFFSFFNFNPALIVIERNGLVVPSTLWSTTYLTSDDKLEFLTIVGGG